MNNKNNFELFPTLITRYDQIFTQDQLNDIYDYCKNEPQNDYFLLLGEGKSSYDINSQILDKIGMDVKSCNKINVFLQGLLDQYTLDIGINSVQVQNSWFNIQQENSTLLQHYHPMSVISAAIYVKVDEKSSKIYFENPNNLVRHLNSYKGEVNSYNKFNNEFFWFSVKPGDIIIFPSWIKHGGHFETNKTFDRTVISLNAF
ncbi:MAG: hypothetical protein EBS69_08620 [Verrucomicrobia bacterium]|nr:hypothetical protein [Verrucomicrobiota bacterium]NBS79658.1 hypothetical protein [bacterium]